MVRFYRILFVGEHYEILFMQFSLDYKLAVDFASSSRLRVVRSRRPPLWKRIIVAEVDVFADCKRNVCRHLLTLELGA